MDKPLAKILLLAGILLVAAALLVEKGIKIPLGRLPGDIMIKKENFSFYFPVATSIIVSIILSVILYLAGRR